MRRFRFSLRWLLAVVAFIAAACTALVNASAIWLTALTTFTSSLLLLALLAVIVSRGARQAFAIGFLTCGGPP
jgi:hypothetical protein